MEMDLIQYQLDPDLYPDVNWQDEILHKTSFQQTYYVSAQGGGSIARYFVSMGMSKESAAYIQTLTAVTRQTQDTTHIIIEPIWISMLLSQPPSIWGWTDLYPIKKSREWLTQIYFGMLSQC